MKVNNAGKNMSLRAQTTDKIIKQNAQKQDADVLQAKSMLNMIHLEALS